MRTVSYPGASGTQTVTISHDALSRRTGVDRPGAAADTTYAYDVDNDLTGLTHAFVAGTGPGSTAFTYGHDASGKVTSIGINQPVFEWMPTLAYARIYGAADNRNRIGSVSDPTEARTLTWNPDGDLTQEVRTRTGRPPVTWTYHWTYGHRLAGVTNDAPAAALTATYSYDSDDRRTKTVVNGLLTYTLWSGTNELAQYDASGAVVRRFIPDGTGTMDARLATVTPDGTVYWHHTDHQGSVIATSTADGQVHAIATYSLHGEGAPPTQSPFGYTGREYDQDTGLYYYRARYYSPYLGTFLSMDPIGTKDDPNLYMYVGLDPANGTDPTGEHKEYVWTGRNDLTIVVPIYISAADAALISATQADISSRLSAEFDGSYTRRTGYFWNRRTETVNVTVQARFEAAPGPGINNITAVPGLVRGRVDRIGGQEIMLEPTDSGSGVIVHEVGHLLGAEDHYDKTTFKPESLWGGNLMGDRAAIDLAAPSGSIDQRNFDEIFSHSPTSEICGPTGDPGRCK